MILPRLFLLECGKIRIKSPLLQPTRNVNIIVLIQKNTESRGGIQLDEEKLDVNFKYVFDDNYNPVYVNGAYGGISPMGEIVANFYFERKPIPYESTYKINKNGEVLDEEVVKPANHDENYVRFVSTGVILNLDSAKAIHKWLGEHIESLERQKRSENGGE